MMMMIRRCPLRVSHSLLFEVLSSSILFDRLVSLMSSRNHAGDLNRRGRGQLLL